MIDVCLSEEWFGWSWRLRGPVEVLATGSRHYDTSRAARDAIDIVRAAVAELSGNEESFPDTDVDAPDIILEQEHGQGASECQGQPSTPLYDQRGDGIGDASRLDAALDDVDDAVWLVPAMALTESTSEGATDRHVSSVPTTQELDCQTCSSEPTMFSRSTANTRPRYLRSLPCSSHIGSRN